MTNPTPGFHLKIIRGRLIMFYQTQRANRLYQNLKHTTDIMISSLYTPWKRWFVILMRSKPGKNMAMVPEMIHSGEYLH